ncbi:MAG: aminoacyl-tRNA hydrolase [Anaerolineales bacterium]
MSGTITPLERLPYMIVGLGNPGKEYAQSRHNIGFMVLDRLAERFGVSFSRYEQKALVAKVPAEQRMLILAKPQTFMNLSGQSVAPLARFYQVPSDQLMIVYDDIDLPFGTLRIRASGSSAGHKGMQSILDRLGRQDVPRLRVGVGRPRGAKAAAQYVLREFSAQEKIDLPLILERAAQAVQDWFSLGIVEAMNRHNVNLLANEP